CWYSWSVLKAVTLKEIEQIFEILDRLSISREAVIIPLRPASPGAVKKMPNGKIEIVVEAELPIEQWLPKLEEQLHQLVDRER
ncbi:MAG TPA: hypothetical protein VMT89_04145, partial [Candidatus Acidoferrales bacterium]|nr:hypothetical protein [Candidatus Acidoferrales bacterium]